jgi:hypothetical protein
MNPEIDISGMRYGRLVVLHVASRAPLKWTCADNRSRWEPEGR